MRNTNTYRWNRCLIVGDIIQCCYLMMNDNIMFSILYKKETQKQRKNSRDMKTKYNFNTFYEFFLIFKPCNYFTKCSLNEKKSFSLLVVLKLNKETNIKSHTTKVMIIWSLSSILHLMACHTSKVIFCGKNTRWNLK